MRNLHTVIAGNLLSRKQPVLLFVLILISTLLSCSRNDRAMQEQLYGRWEIAKAEHNGKETNYLRGGYFIIDQNNQMTFNISGEDEKGAFRIDHHKLVMRDKTFELQLVRSDSMILKYETEPGNQFEFYLHKNQRDVK